MQIDILSQDDGREILRKLEEIIKLLVHQSAPSKEVYYTNNEVAVKFGVSKKTLSNWRNTGKIAYTKIGRKIFYTQEGLADFLNVYNNKTF